MTDIREDAGTPRKRFSVRPVLIGWLCWTLYSFVHAAMITVQEQSAPYLLVWIGSLLYCYLYGLLSIGVWYWTRFLFPRGWPVQIGGHILGAVIYPLIWYILYTSSFIALWGRELFEVTRIEDYRIWILSSSAMIYGVVAGIFHTIEYRRRMHQKELNERELLLRASRMELAVLKSQLNPHFLFNTLNTVNALIGSDPERARSVIAHLADTLRYSLDSDRRQLVPLEDEIRFVETYLAIEQERFGDRIRARLDIPRETRSLLVPPMILQPLVENAIRHGIVHRAGGGSIDLAIRRQGSILQVTITDDGTGAPGREPDELLRSGRGLYNTDQRLRKMFGPENGLDLKTGPTGFQVRFALPALEDAPHGTSATPEYLVMEAGKSQ